jgi:hypothetical protein
VSRRSFRPGRPLFFSANPKSSHFILLFQSFPQQAVDGDPDEANRRDDKPVGSAEWTHAFSGCGYFDFGGGDHGVFSFIPFLNGCLETVFLTSSVSDIKRLADSPS